MNSAPAVDMRAMSAFKPFTTLLTAFQNTSVRALPQHLGRRERRLLDEGQHLNSYLQGAETLRDAKEGSGVKGEKWLLHILNTALENAVLMSGIPHGATISGASSFFKGRGTFFFLFF